MLIFEDEHIRVIHRPGATRWTLLTFNVIDFQVADLRFWADRFVEKAGLSAFGFVSRRPNWFPAASMRRAAEAIAPHLAEYPERVLYGHSQGGYAALKYSALLGAGTIISSCPQATIDPREVPDDQRFHRFFRPELHAGMHIGAGVAGADVAGTAFILYDPFDGVDAMHVRRILPWVPQARLVPVYLTQHSAIVAFAGTEPGLELIEACRRDDLPGLKALARRCRRHHWLRVRGAALAATRRRLGWGDRIKRSYEHLLPPTERTGLTAAQASLLQGLGRFAEAEGILQLILEEKPDDRDCLRRLVAVRIAMGDREGALGYARCRAAAAQSDPEALDQVASLLLQLGRPAEAAPWAVQAVNLSPNDPRFLRRATAALHQEGCLHDALDHAVKAAELEPLNPATHRVLAEILMAAGQPTWAIDALEAGTRALPGHAGLRMALAQARDCIHGT
jgi:tetratricopeptide (TPR) repeat protein